VAPDDSFAQPAFAKVFLAFAFGLALGAAFVLPVVRDDLAPLASGGSGAVRGVLLIGLFSIVIVSMGLFGLYRISH